MNRTILTYGGYFEAFMESLQDKEKEKVQYGLLLFKALQIKEDYYADKRSQNT